MTREEAIRRIKAWNLDSDDMEVLTEVIPELAESEDEKTRKGLIKLLTVASDAYLVESTGIKKDAYLAWLEKQKEQKPIIQDVELNDAVYDYVRDHFIAGADFTPEYIKKLMENAFFAGVDYYLLKQESESCEPDTNVEKVIEDVIRVYGKTQGEWVGGYDVDTLIVNLRRAFNMKGQKPGWKINNPHTTKWTKEMIDEKFKELVEEYHKQNQVEDIEKEIVDYWESTEWSKEISLEKFKVIARYFYGLRLNAEQQKPAEWDELQADFRNINEAFENGKKEVVDNPKRYGLCRPAEWSDTDTIGWDEAFACVTRAEKAAKNEEELQNAVTAEKWLKEIKFKYYVHPVKQEWSEEDEKMVNNILSVLGQYIDYKAVSGTGSGYATPRYGKEIDWLKSLRPQPQKDDWDSLQEDFRSHNVAFEAGREFERNRKPRWKPSEEQMEALESAVKLYKDTHYEMYHERIVSLYEQLKKLTYEG